MSASAKTTVGSLKLTPGPASFSACGSHGSARAGMAGAFTVLAEGGTIRVQLPAFSPESDHDSTIAPPSAAARDAFASVVQLAVGRAITVESTVALSRTGRGSVTAKSMSVFAAGALRLAI